MNEKYYALQKNYLSKLSRKKPLSRKEEAFYARIIKKRKIQKYYAFLMLYSVRNFFLNLKENEIRDFFENSFEDESSQDKLLRFREEIYFSHLSKASILLFQLGFNDENINIILKQLKKQLGSSVENFQKAEEEIKELSKEIIKNRNIFIEANTKLVISLAHRYAKKNDLILDLVQEGNIGLIKAIERFDYKLGFKFSTYATWYIKQSILSAVSCHSKDIRVPIHAMMAVNRLYKTIKQIAKDRPDDIHDLEKLKKALNSISISQVKNALIAQNLTSLDSQVNDNDGNKCDRLMDFVKSQNDNPQEQLLDRNLKILINESLKQLTPREEKILRLRFGLGLDN